jgi:hypothetical protein
MAGAAFAALAQPPTRHPVDHVAVRTDNVKRLGHPLASSYVGHGPRGHAEIMQQRQHALANDQHGYGVNDECIGEIRSVTRKKGVRRN